MYFSSMKCFYIKVIKVVLIVFNATFSFSQNSSNIDSLLNIVELRIEQEDN